MKALGALGLSGILFIVWCLLAYSLRDEIQCWRCPCACPKEKPKPCLTTKSAP